MESAENWKWILQIIIRLKSYDLDLLSDIIFNRISINKGPRHITTGGRPARDTLFSIIRALHYGADDYADLSSLYILHKLYAMMRVVLLLLSDTEIFPSSAVRTYPKSLFGFVFSAPKSPKIMWSRVCNAFDNFVTIGVGAWRSRIRVPATFRI